MRKRVWRDADGVVCLRDEDGMGEEIVRRFVLRGTYVYEITDSHIGHQVCGGLATRGITLTATEAGLPELVRREYRAATRLRRYWEGSGMGD